MLPIILSLLLALQTAPQIPTPRIKKEVNLVLVDVQVVEKSTGKIISGLDKSDFVLNDTGEKRDLAVFERETTPLDVVLLVDTSAGVGRGIPRDLSEGLRMMVRELRPGDRMAVMSFASEARLKTPLTDDETVAWNAIGSALRDRLHSGHKAKIYNALIAASSLFPKPRRESRRRAIFVVTHNREESSPSNIHAATTALLEADATLEGLVVQQIEQSSGIKTGSGIPIPGRKGGPMIIVEKPSEVEKQLLHDLHSIEPIAEATGGEVLHYNFQAQEWWREAIQRLRSRYLLGFYTAPANGQQRELRRIKVELAGKAKAKYPDAIVRAPQGYYID